MDLDTVEDWLIEVQSRMPEVLGLPAASGWWPAKPGVAFTNFATAFMLRAASEVCSSVNLIVHANRGAGGVDGSIVDAFTGVHTNFRPSTGTVLVDFSVQNPKSSDPFEFTAESEVGNHSLGSDYLKLKSGNDDDYAWDFFKLLAVPSKNRVFFATVHGPKDKSYVRCKKLTKNLVAVYHRFSSALVRPNDRIAIVVIPRHSSQKNNTWLCSMQNGVIRTAIIRKKFS